MIEFLGIIIVLALIMPIHKNDEYENQIINELKIIK